VPGSQSSLSQLVGVSRRCARPGAHTRTLRSLPPPTSEKAPWTAVFAEALAISQILLRVDQRLTDAERSGHSQSLLGRPAVASSGLDDACRGRRDRRREHTEKVPAGDRKSAGVFSVWTRTLSWPHATTKPRIHQPASRLRENAHTRARMPHRGIRANSGWSGAPRVARSQAGAEVTTKGSR